MFLHASMKVCWFYLYARSPAPKSKQTFNYIGGQIRPHIVRTITNGHDFGIWRSLNGNPVGHRRNGYLYSNTIQHLGSTLYRQMCSSFVYISCIGCIFCGTAIIISWTNSYHSCYTTTLFFHTFARHQSRETCYWSSFMKYRQPCLKPFQWPLSCHQAVMDMNEIRNIYYSTW